MEAAGADVLVAGHVHTGVHHRLRGDRPRDVLVLKDWSRAPSAVRFDGTRISLAPA
jgi:UDP-2,3-diacylglucosamine pyrophosphatase LpxH